MSSRRPVSSAGRNTPQARYVSPPSAPAHQVTAMTKVTVRSGNAMSVSNTRSSQERGSATDLTHPNTPGCRGR